VILPGTHSKWASVTGGAIADFQTYLTGELFELLSKHSFLRHSVADGEGGPPVPCRDLLGAGAATPRQCRPRRQPRLPLRPRHRRRDRRGGGRRTPDAIAADPHHRDALACPRLPRRADDRRVRGGGARRRTARRGGPRPPRVENRNALR